MTLEESREVIPLMKNMIKQIEDQQELIAEMYQEMEQWGGQLNLFQEQNQRLQELNNELQEQLQILPSIGTVGTIGEEGWRSSDIERGIAELQNRLEKARDVDERFKKLKARRADGGNAGNVGEHRKGTDTAKYEHGKDN